MKRRLVLMGPPASGKGTQAGMIEARYDLEAVSTGAMLREEQRKGTALGAVVQDIIDGGRLVPDEMITALVADWVAKRDGERGFLLDGFPRTVPQAEALDRILAEHSLSLDGALFFDVPFEEISSRVLGRVGCSACGRIFKVGLQVASLDAPCPSCGGVLERRADDTLETLRQRMDEYHHKTSPVLSYYEQRGLLLRIPGGGQPEDVFARVAAVLDQGDSGK